MKFTVKFHEMKIYGFNVKVLTSGKTATYSFTNVPIIAHFYIKQNELFSS